MRTHALTRGDSGAQWWPEEPWAAALRTRSLRQLGALYDAGEFAARVRYRLGFRELGATLGLQCAGGEAAAWAARVRELHEYWRPRLLDRDADITPVMAAVSIAPGVACAGYAKPLQRGGGGGGGA